MFMSTDSILKELSYIARNNLDITDFLEQGSEFLDGIGISEAEYNKVTPHLRFEILDVDKFVKVNECQKVDNPRAFDRDNIPSADGLLSNQIFGITKDERAGTFAYIDLHGYFMDPSCYKTWIRLDKNIRNCVHGIGYYSIDKDGFIVPDPEGKTGIEFLRKNIKTINFKPSKSIRKNLSIDFLEANRDKIFIDKYIVIPPFYRDKNTSDSRTVGLGGVNKLYTSLMVAANALETTQDYAFDASDAMRGRVQECILNIYDWFSGNTNDNIQTDIGAGMSGKLGILARTNMSKTANFSSRLVISAPELKVERPQDLMVNFDRSAIPLAAVLAEFRDFILFHVRRFFDTEFVGKETYPIVDKFGKLKYVTIKDPEITFSDDRIKLEMHRFLHGYNNRFVPVEIPVEGTKEVYYMRFVGTGVDPSTIQVDDKGEYVNTSNPESIVNRRMTWCDIFYIAAVEATTNKKVLITRFPVDSYTNQIVTGIEVSSTLKTEPVVYNNKFYRFYPKIRESDINTDTSNKFVDTAKMSNIYLKGMGADYDGDQITCKGIYTEEANDECNKFMYSKENFVNFGCKPSKVPGDDVGQTTYSLTKILSDTKITTPVF